MRRSVGVLIGGCVVSCATAPAEGPRAVPPAPTPCAVGSIVSNPDTPPTILSSTRPVFPRKAFDEKVQGEVLVEVIINELGEPICYR
jgi:hypothetical protein